MNPFQFKNPEYLWALLALPVLWACFWLFRRYTKKIQAKFGEQYLLQPLLVEYSKYRDVFREILLLIVFALLIIAAARPQIGSKIKVEQSGDGEVVLALDVSNSMLAKDLQPDRLTVAKKMISEIYRMLDAKIGLILFAGDAYVQIPMSSGLSSADIFLSSVSPESVPVQGTDFAAAIELAVSMFDKSEKTAKSLLVFTDGEDHEAKAIEAAKGAAKKGIKIYTIGLGKEAATPIIDPLTGVYKKDAQNNPVLTKLNRVLLQQIANAGKGKYIQTGNMFANLRQIKTLIADAGSSGQKQTIEEYEDLFPLCIFLAIILLSLEFFLLDKRNTYLSGLFTS